MVSNARGLKLRQDCLYGIGLHTKDKANAAEVDKNDNGNGDDDDDAGLRDKVILAPMVG